MRKTDGTNDKMEIVWQTPSIHPQRRDYIFRDGIRYVRPYYFEFVSHAKNRWAGKTIVDLFADEFKGRDRHYYVSAVKAGRIQVDGHIVPVSYVVQSSQKISHFLHRHEPPVMANNIQILHSEPDVLTVCKPASVPIESGEVKKQYIARVIGEFPDNEQIANANVNYNHREGKSTTEVIDDGFNGNNASKGKVACTKFTRISTNGTESIVLCEPITGRTHQIRVHLQFLGHPIANDMLYMSECVPLRSTEGSSADRAANNSCPFFIDETVEDFPIDPMCTNCPNLAPKGYDGREEGLWLHCVRYSGPGWTYECPYPDWASKITFCSHMLALLHSCAIAVITKVLKESVLRNLIELLSYNLSQVSSLVGIMINDSFVCRQLVLKQTEI
ncbi:pseudouridine synthase family protein [Striga asiatica]|uniref:Pseudouridine synthase family protein n=1 Tax=Striga asiatica TaxID=4170 RepID=A0A5A7QGL3_STRAF|nr:pseudouridine synthase family protein [Striga asiatica]